MPYDIVKRGTKFVVQKQDGSKTFGTHDTEADAKRQLAALYAAEPKTAAMRELHLLGATGTARTEMLDGKEYLVVPVVALMEGVIHAVNAETPELVPLETLKKAAESWNGRPVTLGHPKRDGKQCSANHPAIIEAHGLGTIKNSRVVGTKLLQEAWIEKAKAKRLHPDLYARLASGETEEVSVGAMVVTDKTGGRWTNGKQYLASWALAEGDHLAFLPGGRGACSIEMGCGTHRAAMRVCEGGMELEETGMVTPIIDSDLRVAAISQKERDAIPESDFAGKNKSFYIQAPKDVSDAADSIGRAGPGNYSSDQLKANIIRIAKRKGASFVAALPDAWKKEMKAAQDGDTPEADAAEEQAELIAYQTMRAAWDACDKQWDQISDLIDALIADETENPTETDAEEEAEEQVETARIESIRTLCQAVSGALNGIIGLTYGDALRDSDAYPSRMMEALAGARHSNKDMALIQQVHDGAQALGATCDRANYRTMEDGKISDPDAKLNARNLDDPNRNYIELVRQRTAK